MFRSTIIRMFSALLSHREVDNAGTVRYYNRRKQLHRVGGKPAVQFKNGRTEWWVGGKLHRDGDEPALIRRDGTQEWYVNGKRHREGDLSAIIPSERNQTDAREWWFDGKCHRTPGKPAVLHVDGSEEYWENGYLVRTLTAQEADEEHGDISPLA